MRRIRLRAVRHFAPCLAQNKASKVQTIILPDSTIQNAVVERISMALFGAISVKKPDDRGAKSVF